MTTPPPRHPSTPPAAAAPCTLFRLTRQEAQLVLFILLVFAVGLVTKHARDRAREHSPHQQPPPPPPAATTPAPPPGD